MAELVNKSWAVVDSLGNTHSFGSAGTQMRRKVVECDREGMDGVYVVTFYDAEGDMIAVFTNPVRVEVF
jgi:hypothetical protein